jgi:hypothetical protein
MGSAVKTPILPAMALRTSRTSIRIQGLRTLLRTRELVNRLAAKGMELAIDAVRALLMADRGRRRYL